MIVLISVVSTLCFCVCISGCSGQTSKSIDQTTPKPPSNIQTTTSKISESNLPNKIRNSKLKFQLNGKNGVNGVLYLFAEDEKVQNVTDPSCYSMGGGSIRSGDYDLYLDHDSNSIPQKQDVPLFPDSTLEFNDSHPQSQIYTDPQKQLPDLLILKQTMACTGDEMILLTLSPDGKRVQQLRFQSAGSSQNMIVAKEIDRLAPDQFRTMLYDHTKSLYRITTWQWIPDKNIWNEQSSTYTKNPK